jgi:hypothetical protein
MLTLNRSSRSVKPRLVKSQKSVKDPIWAALKKDREVIFFMRFVDRYQLREQAAKALADKRAILQAK